jgi:hypothetical protein
LYFSSKHNSNNNRFSEPQPNNKKKKKQKKKTKGEIKYRAKKFLFIDEFYTDVIIWSNRQFQEK